MSPAPKPKRPGRRARRDAKRAEIVTDALNRDTERNVAADAEFGKQMMTLLEIANMIDPGIVRGVLLALVPPSIHDEMVGTLCATAEQNAPALAETIRYAFTPELQDGREQRPCPAGFFCMHDHKCPGTV